MKNFWPGLRESRAYFLLFPLPFLLLVGAGCTVPWLSQAVDVDSEAIDFHDGATFVVEGRDVAVRTWKTGESATLDWRYTQQQETAASQAAREAARNAPVGQEVDMPDAVYEDVTTSGTIATDALGNAERILLPSYWPAGEYDVRGQENSVLWLSRQQYDELVTTRNSHIALGLFDSTLSSVLNIGENIEGALAKLQGDLAANEASNQDVTKLTAEADWGDYIVTVNGQQARVRTVVAENMFARYRILANPENPLILSVSIRPFALGLDMFSVLSTLKSLAGYQVTSITY